MTTITVYRPAEVHAPRAAAWAAWAFHRLLSGIERAAGNLRQRRQTASRASEAAGVRAYAREVEAVDPRFAADLRAAADRHEQGH